MNYNKTTIFVLWSLLLTWELTSCRDKVIVSSANPVQFWPVADSTYNETAVCSIEPVFWCQPWHCDDKIITQFVPDADTEYWMLIYDSHGDFLTGEPFTPITDYVYDELELTDYCCQEISLGIAPAQNVGFLRPPRGAGHEINEDWVDGNDGFSILAFDLKTPTQFIESSPVSGTHYNAYQPLFVASGQQLPPIGVIIQGSIFNTPTPGLTVEFSLWTFWGGSKISSTSITINGGAIPNFNGTVVLPPPSALGDPPATILMVDAVYAGTSLSDMTITLTNIGTLLTESRLSHIDPDTGYYVITSPLSHKSDCLEILDSEEGGDCTVKISYSNSNDFDDINFPSVSPGNEFELRVPAIFFDEDWPEEYETIELSDSDMVQLSSEVKHKKLLDIGFIPFYFAQKLKLVLAFDNVIIQGMNWIKGDGMTKVPGNKRYPLKKWQALLTDKDFIKRNVL